MLLLASALLGRTIAADSAAPASRPNVVIIYADDLGYGDVSCYGATGVATPNVDRLAREGRRFTNGYATSSSCTPSRYSLLTGEYAFRMPGARILRGDANLLIPVDRPTIASVMHDAGYATGMVGKWHLGLGRTGETINWNTEIKPGPNELGFDYYFMMAATGDRTPCVYLENRHVIGLDPADPIEVSYVKNFPGEPTGISERDHLKMDWSSNHNQSVVNGIGRVGFMRGGKAALWKDEDMGDTFAAHAVKFIENNRDHPFFLYYATHNIHVPRVPNQRFVGKTDMGPRGDSIVEFDDAVGKVLATLDRLGLTERTIVILSSDNGPVLDDGYKDQAIERLGDHRPAGPLRAGKYSIFEGGTRVPFIVRWSGQMKAGTSDAVISQVDLLASLATLAGRPVPATARDSQDLSAALFGQTPAAGRSQMIEHSSQLGLRAGNWKYIEPMSDVPAYIRNGKQRFYREGDSFAEERGFSSEPQLYDLNADPSEHNNLAGQNPDQTARMAEKLKEIAGHDAK